MCVQRGLCVWSPCVCMAAWRLLSTAWSVNTWRSGLVTVQPHCVWTLNYRLESGGCLKTHACLLIRQHLNHFFGLNKTSLWSETVIFLLPWMPIAPVLGFVWHYRLWNLLIFSLSGPSFRPLLWGHVSLCVAFAGTTVASWSSACVMRGGLQCITSHLRAAGRWFHHSNSTSLQVLAALGVVFDCNPTHLPFSLLLTQTTQCSFVWREKEWRDSPPAHECDITGVVVCRLWEC